MSNIIGQDRVTIWFQPDGSNTPFKVLGIGENSAAMTGKTVPGPGRTPVYGRDRYGRPVVIKMNRDAPGDLPSATLQIYDKAQVDFLLEALHRGCPINIQSRVSKCGNLTNPNNWDALDHWGGGEITQYTPGDGPSLEYNGEALTAEASISFTHHLRLVRTELSALGTPTTDAPVGALAAIPDAGCGDCIAGYPGADKLVFAAITQSLAAPVLNYSRNGGTSWATMSNTNIASASGTVVGMEANLIGRNQVRVVVAVEEDVYYDDVTLGDEGTASFNAASFYDTAGASYTPTAVQAMGWLLYDAMYVAADGQIFKSTNQGERFDMVYEDSTTPPAINAFAVSYDESQVFAAGANGLILRETDGSGEFVTRAAPTAGLAFTSLEVAGDGLLYAGYGTSLYVSNDEAYAAGNWEQLKDFTAGHSIIAIQCIGSDRAMGGDSQLLRVVENSGTEGYVWESVDGGANFVMVEALSNGEYAAAYFSQINDNKAIVAGADAAGTASAVHSLAAV